MPRTIVPFMSSPRASSACAAMKGAAPTTFGLARISASVFCGSGSAPPPGANTSMCETTPSMRSRTSF